MQNLCVGHVHLMLFVSVSFALGQRKHSFQWNMGFTCFRANNVGVNKMCIDYLQLITNLIWEHPLGIVLYQMPLNGERKLCQGLH